MPDERYTVRVTKDHLVFSAGHFITYDGDHCERLHGHNYRTAVSVVGPLDGNHYVFDFIALLERTKEVVAQLDHHMLVALHNPLLTVEETPGTVRVRYRTKEWSFPREDCVLLPIENTTTEVLARWIGQQVVAALFTRHNFIPQTVRVEVEENVGQSAVVEWNPA
jgi:6-pyruvoyltetrahydropterin/6-carboxytetrahydropterin synthase